MKKALYLLTKGKLLRIRLSRTGRKNYPSYRIVVAEHARPVKGKFIEIIGHYIPIRDPKVLEFDQEKIKEWIAKGAKPTDTVASLLKNAGMTGLDAYIEPKDKKKKKKKEMKEEEGGTAPAAPAAPAAEGTEAPADEPKPDEPKADEPKAEEPKPDEPKPDEPKAEEPKAEEPKAEEPKAEEPKAE
ncbi:30S ribosomal protein S16 [Patescibacteria group bacterium]